MTTERQPGRQPSGTRQRGAWTIERPGRPHPHGVQWSERVWDAKRQREVRRRPTEFFEHEADRDARMAEIISAKKKGSPQEITRTELHEWRAFKTAIGAVPWQVVVSGYLEHLAATGRQPCTVTVEAWTKSYLNECAARVLRGELSKDSERHKRRLLRAFAASFGHVLLDQVEAPAVVAWLDSLGFRSAATFNSARKLLTACFNAAMKARIIRTNPIEGLDERVFINDNRGKILTPREAAQLFYFAQRNAVFRRCLGPGALEAFAGVRFSSAFRVAAGDIHFAERGFLLPAAKLKTGMRDGVSHYVDTNNLPGLENLWRWLALAPAEAWTMRPDEWMALKSAWFIAAGVRHPRNTLRKSFATYDLARHKNPGRTAYILGHRDQGELWRDYKGNATSADAELYQSISPETAAEIARGAWKPSPSPRRKAGARRGGKA